jgi:hypothetical protein
MAVNSVHIWPEERSRRDGVLVSSASIEIPGREKLRLWYEIPEERERQLPEHSDHFAIGFTYLVMQLGMDVHIHGQVSPSLLRNLQEYRAAWCQMVPGLVNVDIRADVEREADPPAGRQGAIVTFSGGVDSAFTAFRHIRGAGLRHPREVSAGMMFHGHDIPIGKRETFARARERTARMASSIGLELIPVATNYREVVSDWPHSHGAAVASCLALFSAGYREGLVPQTWTYSEIRYIAEGVNALTDPLLSSDTFWFISDGAAFSRAEKILALKEWKEFLRDLRVCWQGENNYENCCACEKCIQNILTFRALGLGLPEAFKYDVDDEQIRRFGPGEESRAAIKYAGLGALAAASGSSGPWVKILERKLVDDRRRRRSKAYGQWLRVRTHVERRLRRLLPIRPAHDARSSSRTPSGRPS